MSPRIKDIGLEILVDPERVHPFQDQPRKHFSKRGLEELADSIETSGQLQPATVRILCGDGDDTEFELIDGERRWRACLIKRVAASCGHSARREREFAAPPIRSVKFREGRPYPSRNCPCSGENSSRFSLDPRAVGQAFR
ncbi:hypothetical protein EPN83_00810 [Patescibacteria group bacterium]|nr:MAG: hypothetical protein EPN83_00810 [Patescibacteria group bacterium]